VIAGEEASPPLAAGVVGVLLALVLAALVPPLVGLVVLVDEVGRVGDDADDPLELACDGLLVGERDVGAVVAPGGGVFGDRPLVEDVAGEFVQELDLAGGGSV